jgi:hypothetical protein
MIVVGTSSEISYLGMPGNELIPQGNKVIETTNLGVRSSNLFGRAITP